MVESYELTYGGVIIGTEYPEYEYLTIRLKGNVSHSLISTFASHVKCSIYTAILVEACNPSYSTIPNLLECPGDEELTST